AAVAAAATLRWVPLAQCHRAGRAEIAVIATRTAGAIEHGECRVEALQHHLGRITVLPVLVLPFARLQRAFQINFRALFQILLGDFGKAFAEDDDPMPLRLLASLAGVLVTPRI